MDYIYYLLGYEEEVVADEKQVKQRHLMNKQISHNKEFKLKSIEGDSMLESYLFDPAMPVGKVIVPKKHVKWSTVVKKSKKNRFDILNETKNKILA